MNKMSWTAEEINLLRNEYEKQTSMIRFFNKVGFVIKRKNKKLQFLLKRKISKQYPYAKKYYEILYLEKQGLKTTEIIPKLEVSTQTFYNWKNGKKPLLLKDGLTLENIRKVLGD